MLERQKKTQALLKGKVMLASPPSSKQSQRAAAMAVKPLSAAAHRDKLQMYAEAFARIQEATGIDDIDELMRTFLSAEDENYTLYNYVNGVNDEIEKLEGTIAGLTSDISAFRGTGAMSANEARKAHRMALETLARTESLEATYTRRHAAAGRTLEQLTGAVNDIFNKIGCNTAAVRDLLGDEDVNEANILSYLGIIEQRTNELLQAYAMQRASKRADSGNALHETLRAPALCSLGTRILVEPPSSRVLPDQEEDESEVEEDGPLTRDSIAAKLAKTLPAKLDAAIKIRPAISRKPKAGKTFRG